MIKVQVVGVIQAKHFVLRDFLRSHRFKINTRIFVVLFLAAILHCRKNACVNYNKLFDCVVGIQFSVASHASTAERVDTDRRPTQVSKELNL